MSRRGKFSITHCSVCRALFMTLLLFMLLSIPIYFFGDASTTEHQSIASSSHHGDTDHDGHGGHGHLSSNCGPVSCSPATPNSSVPTVARSAASVWIPIDDAKLSSIYLDCDPPIPRQGYSRA